MKWETEIFLLWMIVHLSTRWGEKSEHTSKLILWLLRCSYITSVRITWDHVNVTSKKVLLFLCCSKCSPGKVADCRLLDLFVQDTEWVTLQSVLKWIAQMSTGSKEMDDGEGVNRRACSIQKAVEGRNSSRDAIRSNRLTSGHQLEPDSGFEWRLCGELSQSWETSPVQLWNTTAHTSNPLKARLTLPEACEWPEVWLGWSGDHFL